MAQDKGKPSRYPSISIDVPNLSAHEEQVTLEKMYFCKSVCSAYRGATFKDDIIKVKCMRIIGQCLYDHPLRR